MTPADSRRLKSRVLTRSARSDLSLSPAIASHKQSCRSVQKESSIRMETVLELGSKKKEEFKKDRFA